MRASIGAELFKIVKRPAVWVLLAAWLVATRSSASSSRT